MKNPSFSLVGLAVACVAGIANADLSGQASALGGTLQYHQASPPTHYHINSFFDVFVEIDIQFSGPVHLPPPPGAPSPGSCGGTTSLGLSLNGLPPGEPYIGNMQSSFFDVFTELSVDGLTSSYNTEMTQLDLTAVGALGPVMIRESPTLQSTGHYTVTTIPGGTFHIDSFFDVFTELSVDGGQTWTPSDGASRLEIGPPSPTPGVACFLVLSGALSQRRRRF